MSPFRSSWLLLGGKPSGSDAPQKVSHGLVILDDRSVGENRGHPVPRFVVLVGDLGQFLEVLGIVRNRHAVTPPRSSNSALALARTSGLRSFPTPTRGPW